MSAEAAEPGFSPHSTWTEDVDVHVVPSDTASGDEGEQWTGMLEFLNDSQCYCKFQDPAVRLRRTTSLVSHEWKNQFPCCFYLRRFKAAFSKSTSIKPVDSSEACSGFRTNVGTVVMSPPIQMLVLLVIIMDVGIMLYKVCVHPTETIGFGSGPGDKELYSDDQVLIFSVIDWFTFSVLCVEIIGRVIYLGTQFTHSLLNLVEFCLVPLMLFELVTRREGVVAGLPMPVVRAGRPIIRSLSIIAKAVRGVNHAMKLRHMLQERVTGSHKRFQGDGFNLDLCYVTSQLIAMGRPSIGKDALFNNSLSEVARFFDTKHTDKYIVINASEHYEYPRWPLQNRIINFPIATHSIPKLAELWELCKAIKTYLDTDERHVVAVHGYFNGGQVGMIIAAYMLFSGSFRQATAAMNNYERSRTASGANESVQGFDNASQRRFIEYFCSCVHEVHSVPDPPPWARLTSIRMLGLDAHKADGISIRLFVRHGLGTYKGKSMDGDEFVEEDNELKECDDDETVVALRDEEIVVRLADETHDKMQFDALGSGCHAMTGAPFLDTASDGNCTCKGRAVQQRGDDPLEDGHVLTWRCEDVEFSGEIRAEVHLAGHSSRESSYRTPSTSKSTKSGGILPRWKSSQKHIGIEVGAVPESTSKPSVDEPSKPSTTLLFASWLHTAFLEHSQSMSMRRELGDNTIGIALGRFGVDKGADAPSLKSYGASFQLQLVFEVDEFLVVQPLKKTVTRKHDDDDEGKRVLRQLHPPDENLDVTDLYSIGWLSWIVERLWPYTEVALVRLVRETVEPLLQESVPGPLKSIHFSTFNLGTSFPEFGPMVASQREGDSVQLDMIIKFRGNANILMDAGIAKLGVNYIELIGTLSILLDPIVNNMPIVGGMKLFFLNPPEVHLKFVGLAEIANMPSIQGVLEGTIQDVFADVLVLPNMLCVTWMPEAAQNGDPPAYLSNRLPNGVLRVVLIEAEGFSQEVRCFVKLKFGASTKKTRTADKSLRPKWDETCDLMMFDPKQTISLEVYATSLTSERLMGQSSQLEIGQLVRGDNPISWIVLDPINFSGKRIRKSRRGSRVGNFKSALSLGTPAEAHFVRLHLRFELFTLVGHPSHLPANITGATNSSVGKNSTSADGATNSSVAKNPTSLPKSGNVGLLVCKCHKGRVPSSSIVAAKLSVRVGASEAVQNCTKSEFSWQNFGELDESMVNTIGVLVREGYPTAKIADILKLPEALVNKVMAHCLDFNIDVHQHLCVFVHDSDLASGIIEFEIKRKGRVEAVASIPLKDVIAGAKKSDLDIMKIRKLVALNDPRSKGNRFTGARPANRYDLDLELQLFAFSSTREERAKTWPEDSSTPRVDIGSELTHQRSRLATV